LRLSEKRGRDSKAAATDKKEKGKLITNENEENNELTWNLYKIFYL